MNLFVIEKIKIHKNEERTHIHFITRLEMKLFVVIADSDFGLFKLRRKNESNPIFWLNNYLMMIFGLLPIMDFYETFLLLLLFTFLFLLPVLHFNMTQRVIRVYFYNIFSSLFSVFCTFFFFYIIN